MSSPRLLSLARAESRRAVIGSRRTAAILMAVYVVVVGLIVFWPSADIASGSVLEIWQVFHWFGAPAWFSTWLVEFITNTLLFVPLGFLGHTFKPLWGWRQWLLAGLAGTLTIELTQWVFLSGRSAQVADVVSNTLGAVLGYALVRVVERRRR